MLAGVEYRITTPELVSFRYEVAGVMTRAMAWLVDQGVLLALRIGMAWAASMILPASLAQAALIVAVLVTDFGYFVVLELVMTGQTPGKRAFSIRVIPDDGTRLVGTSVLIRNLLRVVEAMAPFFFVGGVVMLAERYHRRLGDLAAGTLVVRDVKATIPTAVREAERRHNTFQDNPATRQRILNRVTRADRDLLYDLMLRRDALAPAVRDQLFSRAAAYCRTRFQLPRDVDHLSDEQTVLNVAQVIHQGQGQVGRGRGHD